MSQNYEVQYNDSKPYTTAHYYGLGLGLAAAMGCHLYQNFNVCIYNWKGTCTACFLPMGRSLGFLGEGVYSEFL